MKNHAFLEKIEWVAILLMLAIGLIAHIAQTLL